MDAQTQALTAANIKYLLVLHALDADDGVRCVDVAQALDISRPSVHAMIKTLAGMKLVETEVRCGAFYSAREIACGFIQKEL